MNKVLAVICYCLLPVTVLAQTPAGGQSDTLTPPNIIGADFVYEHINRTDTLGNGFANTRNRGQGIGGSVDLHNNYFSVIYRGQFTASNRARIETNADQVVREEDATAQRHVLVAGVAITPNLRPGAGYIYACQNRAWQGGGQDRTDNCWHGFLLGGSGGLDFSGKLTFDYQIFAAPWLKRREEIDFRSTRIVSGVPVASRITQTRHHDAWAILAGGGATWWILPYFGIRGGADFLTARGENQNVPGRKENFNFVTVSGGGRFRF